jgi:hypothetical protein
VAVQASHKRALESIGDLVSRNTTIGELYVALDNVAPFSNPALRKDVVGLRLARPDETTGIFNTVSFAPLAW